MQCSTNQRVRNHSVYFKEKIDKKILYGSFSKSVS